MEKINILSHQDFESFKYRKQVECLALAQLSSSGQTMPPNEMIDIYNRAAAEYLGGEGLIDDNMARRKKYRKAVTAIAHHQCELLESFSFGFPNTIHGINKRMLNLKLNIIRPAELMILSIESISEAVEWEKVNRKAIQTYAITLGSIVKNICDGIDSLSASQKSSLDVEVSYRWKDNYLIILIMFRNNYLKFIGDDNLEISSIPMDDLKLEMRIDMALTLRQICGIVNPKKHIPSYFLGEALRDTMSIIRGNISVKVFNRHPYVAGPLPSKRVCFSQYQSPVYETCAEGNIFSMLYNLKMWQSIYLLGRTAPHNNPSHFYMGFPKSIKSIVHRALGTSRSECAARYNPQKSECEAIECEAMDRCAHYQSLITAEKIKTTETENGN